MLAVSTPLGSWACAPWCVQDEQAFGKAPGQAERLVDGVLEYEDLPRLHGVGQSCTGTLPSLPPESTVGVRVTFGSIARGTNWLNYSTHGPRSG